MVPKDKLDEIREELFDLGRLVQESPEFYGALNNNTLELRTRERLLDAVLKKLDPPKVLYRFFHILLKQSRISLLTEIVAQFGRDADSRLGRIRGQLLSPIELPADDLQKLEKRLCGYFEGEIILTQMRDSSFLGGFMVRIGDWLFDATLESELKSVMGRISGLSEAGHD